MEEAVPVATEIASIAEFITIVRTLAEGGSRDDDSQRQRALPDAQRAVLARFPNVQTRTLGNGDTQLLGNGSRCDDARLRATLYQFDGAGVLQQISLVWNRPDGPVPSPLFMNGPRCWLACSTRRGRVAGYAEAHAT